VSLNGPPPGSLSHFAINADDLDASRQFYESVFGWQFTPWGPPGFLKITTAEGKQPGPIGALQGRRDLLPGAPTNGLEGTVSVTDIDAVAASVVASGGRILMEKATIPGVGHLIFFADPSGNVLGAMQYS
jgi:predicted enzyme related to lactoylglutathione lyase